MGYKHRSREDMSIMHRYLLQQRYCEIFTRKTLLPKPKFSEYHWQQACDLLNEKTRDRREKLLNIDLNVFEHPEMVRVYGAIVLVMLHQAPNTINITNKLIQQASLSVTVNGLRKPTVVDHKWIKPVMQIISQTEQTDTPTHAFLREVGYKDPQYPVGIATKLHMQDLSLLPQVIANRPVTSYSLCIPSTDYGLTGSLIHLVLHRGEEVEEGCYKGGVIQWSTRGNVAREKTQIGVRGTREGCVESVPLYHYVLQHFTYGSTSQQRSKVTRTFKGLLRSYGLNPDDFIYDKSKGEGVNNGQSYTIYEKCIKLRPEHRGVLEEIRDKIAYDLNLPGLQINLDTFAERRDAQVQIGLEHLTKISKLWLRN